MVQRYPAAQAFANSEATLCFQMRLRGRLVVLEASSVVSLFLAALVAALLLIYLLASCYLVFRDEMLAKLLSNQAETQYAYEDRIVALRAHLDRVATKQLINQDSFEERVNELIARQAQLETRQAIVMTLAVEAQRQGIKRSPASDEIAGSTSRGPAPGVLSPAPSYPRPIPNGDTPQKTSFLPDPELRLGAPAAIAAAKPIMTTDMIAGVAVGLSRIEQNQLMAVSMMEREASAKIGQWRSVLADIGLDKDRFSQRSKAESEIGGPFVPLAHTTNPGPFDRTVSRLQLALSETARLSPAFKALPLQKPLIGDAPVTSSFGARSDPFMHSAALHTGIDFRGGYGSPVHSTAPGKVIVAAPQGGYGNMVEVDHGFGLTTRYAHLSSIGVDVGDSVKMGEIVGHIGSTGRSTGPHLHYETRIDGEATDPMRFMHAMAKLKS